MLGRGTAVNDALPSASWEGFAQEAVQWSQANESVLSIHQLLQNSLLPFLATLQVTKETVKASTILLLPLHWLYPPNSVAVTTTATTDTYDVKINDSSLLLLRQVELQVALRTTLWVWGKEQFAARYQSFWKKAMRASSLSSSSKKSKKKRGASKKPASGKECILHDIIGLLRLAAVRLPPERPFLAFVQECITKRQCTSLDDGLDTIWKTFEVDNPFMIQERNEAIALSSSSSATTSRSKRKRKGAELSKPMNVEKENDDGVVAPLKARNGCDLLVSNVCLTAPVGNSLKATNSRGGGSLLMGRSKRFFVGSHFNTRLSNVQALFRQVNVPLAQTKPCGSSKQQKSMQSTQSAAFQSPKRRRRVSVAETPRPSDNASSQPLNTDGARGRMVLETPLVRQKPIAAIAAAGMALIPAAKTALAPRSLSSSQQQDQHQLPVRAARSVVAEAMMALQRRQDRYK